MPVPGDECIDVKDNDILRMIAIPFVKLYDSVVYSCVNYFLLQF